MGHPKQAILRNSRATLLVLSALDFTSTEQPQTETERASCLYAGRESVKRSSLLCGTQATTAWPHLPHSKMKFYRETGLRSYRCLLAVIRRPTDITSSSRFLLLESGTQ